MPTKILNIGSLNFKCIKIDETKNTLTAAIVMATKSVYAPRLMPATVTVNDVRANNPSQTNT